MKKLSDHELLKRANGWAWEAQWAARKWREDSWRSCELYDGGDSAWTQEDWNNAVDAGIDPITVNSVFPAVQKLVGSQIINRFEIIAKGRTQKDGEISQVMSEGIKFVMDQSHGEFIISAAHADALVPGFGCISPCYNHDPRKERVSLKYRDWKTVWWDPFSNPWWTPDTTKYVFHQPWVDLDDFKALFQEKEREIQNAYDEISGQWKERGFSPLVDESQLVEEEIRSLAGSDWIDTERKRIRPIEMWYPVNSLAVFALYPDGRCYEITKEMDPRQAFQVITNSQQVLKAMVKKMRTMTFFGEHLLLQDIPTPYSHDQYPFVPFIGYIDRWGFPYGVPRQIQGQAEEISKRRSMELAMLRKRRVMIERSAVDNGDEDALDAIYQEANKLDGFMVLADGGLNKFQIDELAKLTPYQIELLRQAQFEIRDITGSNSPYFEGEKSQSGVAKQMDANKSDVTTASLPDNLRRSLGMLGDQLTANIKSSWQYEKVLRVTDRLTGAERFVTVNEPMEDGISVRNDITQGMYDTVISEVPMTDTIREKNLEILYAAIEKSPPQAVPTLLIASFEMSDIPNKELIIEKLKPILGMDPGNEDIDPEEAKQRALAELDAQRQQNQMVQEMQMADAQLELNKKKLENAKIQAQIQEIEAKTEKTEVDTEIAKDSHHIDVNKALIDGVERGIGIEERLNGEGEDDSTTGKRL